MGAKSQGARQAMAVDKIYTEVRAGIRETDSISFRLLGLVPLVSGTALIGLVLQPRTLPASLVILLALFAASVTLGLFRWELRNIQTCPWLIKYADALEAHALTTNGIGEIFRPRPKPPQWIGKTEAEKLIYAITVVVWLALPVAMGAVPQAPYRVAYGVVTGMILVATGTMYLTQSRGSGAPMATVIRDGYLGAETGATGFEPVRAGETRLASTASAPANTRHPLPKCGPYTPLRRTIPRRWGGIC